MRRATVLVAAGAAVAAAVVMAAAVGDLMAAAAGDLRAAAAGNPAFRDMTAESGVAFRHHTGAFGKK